MVEEMQPTILKVFDHLKGEGGNNNSTILKVLQPFKRWEKVCVKKISLQK